MQAMGCNGQLHEPDTRWQLLGNGRRTYNPVLMRFVRPDRLSPFGAGGRNAYAYCGGDPVNRTDPGGGFAIPLMMGMVAVAGGAAAWAAPSASGDERGEGGMSPWMIAAIIVGAALVGAGMISGGRGGGRGTRDPGTSTIPPLLPANFRLKPRAKGTGSRPGPLGKIQSNELPPPYEDTAKAVKRGGPFNFPNHDGEVFHNSDGVLPPQPHGYYVSYAVQYRDLLAVDRGAMRLIAGGFNRTNPDFWYFSRFHYNDLKQVQWRLRGKVLGDRPGHF